MSLDVRCACARTDTSKLVFDEEFANERLAKANKRISLIGGPSLPGQGRGMEGLTLIFVAHQSAQEKERHPLGYWRRSDYDSSL